MERDKIISVRVNSKLLKEFKNIINSFTTTYGDNRPLYEYFNPESKRHEFGKYTIADLLEKALKEYCNNFKPGTK